MLQVTAAVIMNEGKVLIAQRSKEDKLSLKWEFPGGKLEEGETPEACLKREIMEEMNLNIEVLEFMGSCVYSYGTREIELMAYKAHILSGEMKLNVHNDVRWVKISDLNHYDLAPADIELIKVIFTNVRFKYKGNKRMKRIYYNRFPGGKTKALTMSYDDGQIYDRRLVELFNKYHIKGTFHLNSGKFDQDIFVKASEIKALYEGHEVSVHTVSHPNMLNLPNEMLVMEVLEDKRSLEKLVGYPVRGMSYPYGIYSEEILRVISNLGMEYARTVNSTFSYNIPGNLLRWDPTCHHRDNLLERLKEFLAFERESFLPLMYVWGHSFEFERNSNWNVIEEFCELAGNKDNVWYATNIEIVDYVKALKNLKFTVDGDVVYNPSSIPVWISAEGKTYEVKPGETKNL